MIPNHLRLSTKELSKMYKEEKFSPLAGCLPMLIQMPVFFALYQIITKPLTYICGLDDTVITLLRAKAGELLNRGTNLNQIDIISCIKGNAEAFVSILGNTVVPDFTVLGRLLDLSKTPSITNISWLLIIPALTLVTSYLSSYITSKITTQPVPSESELGNSIKYMQYVMPLMSLWISFTVPAIIGVYWVFQNMFGVAQQLILFVMYPNPKVSHVPRKQKDE